MGQLPELSSGPGWAAFSDPSRYLQFGLVLLLATLSGVLLALHPVYGGRSRSLEDIERQKTLVVYAVVGALIAIICTVAPSMAFVIFGIGGLLRFRTATGDSNTTGHIIMATLIGLCWGLGLQLVAALATLYFWVMIYVLEGGSVRELTVVGVAVSELPRAAEAYRAAFTKAGCKVLGQRKSLKKEKLELVMRVPKAFTGDDAAKVVEGIAVELRGTFDWPE
jgi:hypothetical protein